MFLSLQDFPYHLRFETCEHTYRLFDFYLLSKNQIPSEAENKKIFLTCFLIASKYVELPTNQYSIPQLLRWFNHNYAISEILRTEQEILMESDFNMNFDTLSKIYWKKHHKMVPDWSIWLYFCASNTTSIERMVEVLESIHIENENAITKEMFEELKEKLK